jgi:phosphatidate cytidylyltransferase
VLRTRILTTAVALPTVLAVIIFAPNWLFTWFIGALAAWGLYEVGAMTAARSLGRLVVLIAAGATPALAELYAGNRNWLVPGAVIAAMLVLVGHVALKGGRERARPWLTLLGALWVGVLFPYFALLRNLREGVQLVILLLLLVVASDSAAYLAGTRFGKVKLMPRVSPNKTLEGAVAGLGGCVLAAVVLRGPLVAGWGLGETAAAAVAIGILAQLGDLAGSAFKRMAGVKDSGWLFPGHGGLLDRTCSLVFAAVFAYYYTR